ncbi:restriction endonuclease subunit S, partial [Paenibacillus sp. UASWS1643]|uniref:restriction endonuclease subunit S n=1 Tax=Paenibacillus sp. UASWS1643 TaxID=2580422 RepID=UPI00398C21E2
TSNITKNHIYNIQKLDVFNDKIPSRAKRKVKQNDIVYSTVRPNQHHHGIIKVPVENMLASTGFVVLTSKGRYSNDLIYLWLNQEETTTKLQSIAEQSTSTYPSIKPGDILSIKILVPLEKQLNELSDMIEVQHKQIWINQQQNQKLMEIRNSLLPKLMSGEIRVLIDKE